MAFGMGLTVGLGLIIAIGAQNIFVIKQGLLRQHALLCAFICFLCDALLISVSLFGVHHLISQMQSIKKLLFVLASIFLLYYGSRSLLAMYKNTQININSNDQAPLLSTGKIILMSLGFSLLNPQAILDCMVIIGGYAGKYHGISQYQFGMGAIVASFIWFFGLILLTHVARAFITSSRNWRYIEGLSALIMLSIGFSCAWQVI